MANDERTGIPLDPQPGGDGTRAAIWVTLGLVAVLVVVALIAMVWLVAGDDTATDTTTRTTPSTTGDDTTTSDTGPTTSSSSTSTTASSTTTSSSTSTSASSTTDTTAFADIDTAVWPDPSSSDGFDTPEAAASSFATDYVGMVDPDLGPFMQGDSRSGEIELRPQPAGPVTVILLRQLGPDDAWWVIGSVSDQVTVDQPRVLDEVGSPVVVSGEGMVAAGGVLEIELRVDGVDDPIASETVTVSPASPLFRESLAWTSSADWADLVVLVRPSPDGPVTGAATTRLRLVS
jgi:hypothetical protein